MYCLPAVPPREAQGLLKESLRPLGLRLRGVRSLQPLFS